MTTGPQVDESVVAAQRFALRFPEALRRIIPRRDWYTWGRYAVVIDVYDEARCIGKRSHDPRFLLTLVVAVPPCGPIIAAARARRDELRRILADYQVGLILTVYPDQFTRERALREYGKGYMATPEWPPRKKVSARRYKSATSTIRALRARVRELEGQA